MLGAELFRKPLGTEAWRSLYSAKPTRHKKSDPSGAPKILIINDANSRKTVKPAKYILISPQLQISRKKSSFK